MNKTYTIILSAIFAFSAPFSNAKTAIKLKLNHKLGNASFTKNTQVKNNLNHNFNVKRLEYYLSNIIIIHDGGTMDTLKDKYLLINPSGPSEIILLDSLNVTSIESIQFSVGVDKAANHLNPTTYVSWHPLAPKSPSMHWGWTAGYRFIAIEGSCGVSMNQVYEFHGLGDDNYFSTRVPVTATDINGDKQIEINANYEEILKDISLNSGEVAHGNNAGDLKALKNMRDFVFTNTSGQGDILSVKADKKSAFQTYPNPANHSETIKLSNNFDSEVYFKVYDLTGKVVKQLDLGVQNLILDKSGIYHIQAFNKNHQFLASSKVVIL